MDWSHLSSMWVGLVPGAGFMGVDVIRMPFKNIPTLILLLNFCTYIILVFKFIKGILFLFDLDGETRGKNNAL